MLVLELEICYLELETFYLIPKSLKLPDSLLVTVILIVILVVVADADAPKGFVVVMAFPFAFNCILN